MVVRIHAVSRWNLLPKGDHMRFDSVGPRKIRVEVNCSDETRFHVHWMELSKERSCFVATVKGQEILEFAGEGPLVLTAKGQGEVWYYTDDGQVTAIDASHLPAFTKPMQPRHETQEERMRRIADMNTRAMYAKLREEVALEVASLRSQLAQAQVPHNPETGEIDDDEIDTSAASGAAGEAEETPSGEEGSGSEASEGEGARSGSGKSKSDTKEDA